MRKMQPSFAAGELSPSLWARTDMAKYHVGARTLRNMFVHPHGGVSNRPGTLFVGEIPEQARLIPFEFSVEQTYMLVFTDLEMRVIKDGAFVVYPPGHASEGEVVVIESPFAAADLPNVRYTQSFDTLFLAHSSYAPKTLTRTDHHVWTFADMSFVPSASSPSGLTATPGTAATVVYTYRVRYAYRTEVLGVWYVFHGDWTTVTINAPNPLPAGSKVYLSWNKVTSGSYQVQRSVDGGAFSTKYYGTATSFTDTPGSGTTTVSGTESDVGIDLNGVLISYTNGGLPQYKVSAIVDNQESKPSSPVTGAITLPWGSGVRVQLTWSAVEGATGYEVYKNSRGQWGWIGHTDEALEFYDDNIDPDVSFGPRRDPEYLLSTEGQRPQAVALFDQRIVYGRTENNPSSVFGSRVGDFKDFSLSDPLRDDDPVQARPASGRADEIRHLVPFEGLLIFTAGAEWVMTLDGTTPNFDVQSYFGSSSVPPLVVGRSVLFLQRNGRNVRDFAYTLDADGYSGNDMTVLAGHVTEPGRIVDWSYAQNPDSIVWAVREDGALLGFTYMKEHDVHAWHRHDTDGQFLAVGCIPGDEKDDVYFCVKRTVDGEDVYYIEQLADRIADGGVFMDCALSYSGAPADVISGLDHLEGEEVIVLADKNVVKGLTVSGGQITLPREASSVHVGLSYTSDLETLDLDTDQADVGSNQGRAQTVSNVVVRLRDTRGLWAGPDFDHLTEAPFRTFEDYNEPTALFTGDKPITITPQWGRSAKVAIRQTYPLPVTVLAILPELEVGG